MAFNNDDILVLAKAGFTAQQIAALNMVGTAAPTVDTTVATAPAGSEELSAPAPVTPQPTTPPAPAPETPAQGATVDDVLKAINGLGATFQKGFLQGAEQPTPVTADQILAEIINPPLKQTT